MFYLDVVIVVTMVYVTYFYKRFHLLDVIIISAIGKNGDIADTVQCHEYGFNKLITYYLNLMKRDRAKSITVITNIILSKLR